ncbi:Arm DNA-binding domain-containing protein [Kingella potus]|uniref:Arm DNA-binding domain-containing protein n=1 Tax=Kingella potus TaxID=265175 RepID=UPI00313FED48
MRTAKPTDKPYKSSDGHSLYILIQPNGSKDWRFDYAINGKRSMLVISIYPALG